MKYEVRKSKNLKRSLNLLNSNFKLLKGFTLVETLVIIGIMIILIALAIPTYRFFQIESGLENITEKIINSLRLARNKTLASEGASQYGVHFATTTIPHQFTLFKGGSYITRDDTADQISQLPTSVEIYEINLADGGEEIAFNRVVGDTAQAGSLGLRLIDNPGETRTIYIENTEISFVQIPLKSKILGLGL